MSRVKARRWHEGCRQGGVSGERARLHLRLRKRVEQGVLLLHAACDSYEGVERADVDDSAAALAAAQRDE